MRFAWLKDRYIPVALLALVAWHLLSFLIWRQDFWGADAWVQLSWPWSETYLAASLLGGGLLLVVVFGVLFIRGSLWALLLGLMLWFMLLSLHKSTWWVINAGETLLVMMLAILLLDVGHSPKTSKPSISAFVMSLILSLIFFEAAWSKASFDVWWSGLKLQHILSVGTEVRSYVDHLFMVRALRESIVWHLVGTGLVLIEIMLSIAAFYLAVGGRKFPKVRKFIVGSGVTFHGVTLLLLDLGPLPLVFMLAWLWSYRAEPLRLLDLKSDLKTWRALPMGAALVLVLAVSLSILNRQFQLCPSESFQSFAESIRFNRGWHLFSDARIQGKSRLVDIEVEGRSLWTGVRGRLQDPGLALNLYDYYPSREIYLFAQNLRHRYLAERRQLRNGFDSPRDRNPVPERCPLAVQRVFEGERELYTGRNLELKMLVISQNLARDTAPQLNEIWKFHCGF